MTARAQCSRSTAQDAPHSNVAAAATAAHKVNYYNNRFTHTQKYNIGCSKERKCSLSKDIFYTMRTDKSYRNNLLMETCAHDGVDALRFTFFFLLFTLGL